MEEAFDILLAILLKILLMLVATPGMIAPADTATNPASKAYSMRSCPWMSAQMRSRQVHAVAVFIRLSSSLSVILQGIIYCRCCSTNQA